MLSTQSGPSAQALHYARSISPVAAALSVLRPHWNEFGGREGGIDPASGLAITALPPSWTIFFPAAAAVVVGCLVITVLALRRPPPERMPAGTRPPRRTLLRRLMFIIDPNRPPKPIGRVNPMMAKETRTNPLRAGPWMIRTFYAALFVALVLALMAMTGGQTEHGDLLLYTTMILVSFQICVIALVAPSLTSSAVSAELENSTFELLRLTRLRPGSIFWGKLIPVILPSLLPVAAMLPAYAAIGYVDPTYVRPLLRLLPILVSMTLLCACCGLLCSSFTAATARATIAAYIIVVALVVLPLAAWISAGSFISPTLASRLATPSPMVTALSQFPGAIQAEPDLWRNHLLLVSLLIAGFIACTRWRLRALLKRG